MRPITGDDDAVVEALYRSRARGVQGYLDRGPYVWGRIREPRDYTSRGYLIEGDDGPEGYAYVHTAPEESAFEKLLVGAQCRLPPASP